MTQGSVPDLRRAFADAICTTDPLFVQSSKTSWDRPVSDDIVWRFSINLESDWPRSRGDPFVGILVPELSRLVPKIWPTDCYGQHFAGLGGFHKVPTWNGWDDANFDLLSKNGWLLRWKPLTSPAAIQQRARELDSKVAAAVAWLQPFPSAA